MDNRTRIEKYFVKYVNKKIKKEEVRNLILNHPKRVLFINNMTEELSKIEYARLRMFNAHWLKRTVYDMSKLFCHAALTAKEQDIMSEAQKIMKTLEGERKKEEDKIVDQEIEGAIDAKRPPVVNPINK